jgi:hypothetical protein
MSRRLVVATFEREEDLLRAARAARERGWLISDAFTPYAVHGLDHAMGLKRSRLPRVCFLCGLGGVVLALWFQYWTSAWDWPINVGGRPWNSLPAFVPATFETMVLFGGLGVVLAWMMVCRLYPGKKAVLPVPQVSDDRFALVVEESDQPFDRAAVQQVFRDCHAASIEDREETESR